MTDTTIEPIAVKLPAELLERLARWIRLDGTMMTDSGAATGAAFEALREERSRYADFITLRLVELLAEGGATGDLADAIGERARDFAAYRAAQDQKSN